MIEKFAPALLLLPSCLSDLHHLMAKRWIAVSRLWVSRALWCKWFVGEPWLDDFPIHIHLGNRVSWFFSFFSFSFFRCEIWQQSEVSLNISWGLSSLSVFVDFIPSCSLPVKFLSAWIRLTNTWKFLFCVSIVCVCKWQSSVALHIPSLDSDLKCWGEWDFLGGLWDSFSCCSSIRNQ